MNSIADPDFKIFRRNPGLDLSSELFEVLRRLVNLKRGLMSVFFVQEALRFINQVKTNIELMTIRFVGQRIFGLLLNSVAKLTDKFFLDRKFDGDNVHKFFRW